MKSQSVIPRHTSVGPRKIVVCLDGTANAPTDRTNVRSLFEFLAARNSTNLICYYDPGVGTGKLLRVSGSAFGAGFSKNVREAAAFLATHYKPGDEVYIFGFSRGAVQALDLCGFLRVCGLPEPPTKLPNIVSGPELRSYKAETTAFAKTVNTRSSEAEDLVENLWGKFYKKTPDADTNGIRTSVATSKHDQLEEFWRTNGGVRPGRLQIKFLGLWDPVDAVGSVGFGAIRSRDRLERDIARGRGYHNYALGPEIEKACFALSLDELRGAYFPVLPPFRNDCKMSNEPKFVWFPGDHSDVGGGHGDNKELAGLSFNWMLSQVRTNLHTHIGDFTADENTLAPAHDLSVNFGFERLTRRVRAELFHPREATNIIYAGSKPLRQKDDQQPLRSVNSIGWKQELHSSVVERIQAPGTQYLPVQFSSNYVMYPDEGSLQTFMNTFLDRSPSKPSEQTIPTGQTGLSGFVPSR